MLQYQCLPVHVICQNFVDEIKYNHSYYLSSKWHVVIKECFSYFSNRVPDFVREKRFGNWLKDARDWAISRNRYWGTPIPLWVSDDFEEVRKQEFPVDRKAYLYILFAYFDRLLYLRLLQS